MSTTRDPAWLRKAMAPYMPNWRGPQSLRRYEPDSPESIYLAEQAARNGRVLKDSRALAERLAEAARHGLALESRKNPLHPMFRDHNCSYCASGEKPCRQGNPSRCEFPRARND